MPGTRIVFLCIAAAVLFGLVMDQITVRICVEYFSIAHPPVIRTNSPTLLALYWGVAATWWVGFLLGVPLAIVCRAGAGPPLSAGQMVRPLGILLAVMGGCTLLSGITGGILASRGIVTPGDWQWDIPEAAHTGFVADVFAHLAAYGAGFVGGIVLIIWAKRRRQRLR